MPPLCRRRRLGAAIALAAVVAAGLVFHFLLPTSMASDVIGDALYAVAAYMGVVMLTAWSPLPSGGLALGWCTVVELAQLTSLPRDIGTAFLPARLLLGTAFDMRDLIVYACAIVIAVSVDVLLRRRQGKVASV